MEYKDTIFLPKTTFEMRANLPVKEPKILEGWDKQKIEEVEINEEQKKFNIKLSGGDTTFSKKSSFTDSLFSVSKYNHINEISVALKHFLPHRFTVKDADKKKKSKLSHFSGLTQMDKLWDYNKKIHEKKKHKLKDLGQLEIDIAGLGDNSRIFINASH